MIRVRVDVRVRVRVNNLLGSDYIRVSVNLGS